MEVVLDSAITKGLSDGVNPARWKRNLSTILPSPNKISPVKHFAAMPDLQLGGFMQKLRLTDGTAAKALEFLILTNVRSHNFVMRLGVKLIFKRRHGRFLARMTRRQDSG